MCCVTWLKFMPRQNRQTYRKLYGEHLVRFIIIKPSHYYLLFRRSRPWTWANKSRSSQSYNQLSRSLRVIHNKSPSYSNRQKYIQSRACWCCQDTHEIKTDGSPFPDSCPRSSNQKVTHYVKRKVLIFHLQWGNRTFAGTYHAAKGTSQRCILSSSRYLFFY